MLHCTITILVRFRRSQAVSGPYPGTTKVDNRARSPNNFCQKEPSMPAQGCHPVAAHKKLRIPDWYVSSLMLDRALDAILLRVGKLDRTHDIPYLARSEEHTSELQSHLNLVCRLLLEKKKKKT